MKYAVLFLVVSGLLCYHAINQAGYFYALLWPALSFLLVSLSYWGLGPSVFGKRRGRLALINTFLLFPYLCYLWSVWSLLRLVKKESAYHQLNEQLIIGRRLYNAECPAKIDHVIDLTSEFNECSNLRKLDYHNYRILDGFIPQADALQQWVEQAAQLPGTIYIHCAEGHGRTGLFTALLLIKKGIAQTPDQALAMIQAKRPLAKIGSKQQKLLNTVAKRLTNP